MNWKRCQLFKFIKQICSSSVELCIRNTRKTSHKYQWSGHPQGLSAMWPGNCPSNKFSGWPWGTTMWEHWCEDLKITSEETTHTNLFKQTWAKYHSGTIFTLKKILVCIAYYKINDFLLSLERDNWQKEFERSQVLSGYGLSQRLHSWLLLSVWVHILIMLEVKHPSTSQCCAAHLVLTEEEWWSNVDIFAIAADLWT